MNNNNMFAVSDLSESCKPEITGLNANNKNILSAFEISNICTLLISMPNLKVRTGFSLRACPCTDSLNGTLPWGIHDAM